MARAGRLWTGLLVCAWLVGAPLAGHAQSTGGDPNTSGTGVTPGSSSGGPPGANGVPELNATNVGMPLCLIAGALLVASERRRERA